MAGTATSRRIAVATAVLALLGLCSCGTSSSTSVAARSGTAKLRWGPPRLDDPVTIDLDGGYTDTRLSTSQDAIINLPDTVKRGGVTIEGGRNVVLIGGQVTIPAGTPAGVENNRFRTGLYIKGATGTVHVEGVRFSGAVDTEWDAVDIAAPAATVQLENVRADRLRGSFEGFHADAVQPWGGVEALRVDRLTASSNYQGITIPIDNGPIARAELSNVDLHGFGTGEDGGGHLLWLTTGADTCTSYPVRLRHVFIEPRPETKFSKAFWPHLGHPPECGARTRDGIATWPGLPYVDGGVLFGAPRRGSFVPAGLAGLDYVSPGYRGRG